MHESTEAYEVRSDHGRVTIERLTDGIETRLEICVAPDRDVEVRRLYVCNRSPHPRRIEVTSYVEVVLNVAAAHAAHPAFSKLFVQTEYISEPGVLLAYRRPRSSTEHHPWMLHALRGDGPLQYETDRARFVGRNRSLRRPLGLSADVPLSGSAGSVLDPVFSLRRVAQLAPGSSTQLTLLLGAAPTRETALALAALEDPDAAFDRAAEDERALLQRLGIADERAAYWQEVAGAMLYGDPSLRANAAIIRRASGASGRLSRNTGVGPGGRPLAPSSACASGTPR